MPLRPRVGVRYCSAASMSRFRPARSKLCESASVSAAEAQKCEKVDYYATTLPPGPARLGEMLEESAFYSEHLQRISTNVMLAVLVVFAVIFVIIAFGVTPYVGRNTGQTIVR